MQTKLAVHNERRSFTVEDNAYYVANIISIILACYDTVTDVRAANLRTSFLNTALAIYPRIPVSSPSYDQRSDSEYTYAIACPIAEAVLIDANQIGRAHV